MLTFEEVFFEKEEKDGYLIRPLMKKYWAACLEVMAEINQICLNHNISYFVDSDTLLGAVRYSGFCPWTDSLDIAFKRVDYIRFLHYASKELNEGMHINVSDILNRKKTQICSSRKLDNSTEYMKRNHNCPYIAKVNLTVYDNLPDDKNSISWIDDVWKIGMKLSKDWFSSSVCREFDDNEKWILIEEFENLTNQKIDLTRDIPEQLITLCDKASSIFYDEKTNNIIESMSFYGRVEKAKPINSEYVSYVVPMKFENITVFVPNDYEAFLESMYSKEWKAYMPQIDYEKYPVFKDQIDVMKRIYEEKGAQVPVSYLWD